MNDKTNEITSNKLIESLQGPVMVVGAGGFIGVNLLSTLLSVRSDVTGVSRDCKGNWRLLAENIPQRNLADCDITDTNQVRRLINTYQPKTIFNLAAYGAYSKQAEYEKIYQTNFIASVDMIEAAKEYDFSAFIQAGSSSEYGLNSSAPDEQSLLTPNSHYAVSKAATYNSVKYFGKIEKLPVTHMRIYSAYGEWEEPDRLLPVLISAARKNKWPPLVNPEISRDFIHVSDVVNAMIKAAANMNPQLFGEALNVGTGIKTSIKQLTEIIAEVFNIDEKPLFGSMPDRRWDLNDWYANPDKIRKMIDWKYTVDLAYGLKKLAEWQKIINFDNAFWNWTKR